MVQVNQTLAYKLLHYQCLITETNELNQQEAMEVEAPTNVELGNTLVANNNA